MVRDSIRVKDNGYGGAAFITLEENRVAIRIEQKMLKVGENGKADWSNTREAEIVVPNMLDYEPGDVIQGTIIMIEQYEPYDEEYPELHLSWINELTVERINGKPVYRWFHYTEIADARDVKLKINQDQKY